jgi:hypothetical protein
MHFVFEIQVHVPCLRRGLIQLANFHALRFRNLSLIKKKAVKNSRPLQIAKNKKAVKTQEVLHGFDFN